MKKVFLAFIFSAVFFGAVEFLFVQKTTEVASIGIQPDRVPGNFSVASTSFGKFGEKTTIKLVLENRGSIDLGRVAVACKFFSPAGAELITHWIEASGSFKPAERSVLTGAIGPIPSTANRGECVVARAERVPRA